MKRPQGITIAIALLGLGACFGGHRKLEKIPLMWKPTSDITLPTGMTMKSLDTKIQVETFTDKREQPELIAENREDSKPRPVTTRDNVGEFAAKNVSYVLHRMGFTTVQSDGEVILSGELRQYFVEETNTYKGHILLKLNARNSSGKSIWSGTVKGAASRFGRSYKADNYYEVLSDTIINAVYALLEDTDFRAALAKN